MTNEHFTIISVLALSIIIQLTAAIMAFRLIAITGRSSAWSFIALALMLMAVRRMVPLYHLLTGDLTLPPDLLNEEIGLVLSIMMAAGIACIAPLFIERKQAETALRESEAKYRIVADNTYDWEFWLNPEGRFIYTSPSSKRITGHGPDEFITNPGLLQEIIHPDDRLSFESHRKEAEMGRLRENFQFRVIAPSGDVHWLGHVCQPVFDSDGQFIGTRGNNRDITRQKIAEDALEEQLSTLHSILESTNALIFSLDSEYRYTSFNTAHALVMQAIYGVNIQPGHSMLDYMTVEEDREKAKKNLDRALAGERLVESAYSGEEMRSRLYFEVSHNPILAEDGAVVGVAVLSRDITTQKRAEEELLERERHSQSLLRLSRNLERAQTYAEVLNAAQDEVRSVIGYQSLWAYLLSEDKKYFKALIAGGPVSDTVMSEEGTATLVIADDQMLKEIAEAKEIVVVEDARMDERTNKEIVAQLGNRTIVNVPIILFDQHLGSVGMGTFGDEGVRVPTEPERKYLAALASHMAVALDRIHLLTDRKRAEEALHRLNRELRAISNCNQTLMRAVDETTLLSDICRIVCDEAGYRMAWVGYAENDDAGTVRPVAWAGVEDGYLAAANITWSDTERGRGPTGTAIRSGESASIQDFKTDPQAALWREEALKRGYRSSVALPLKDESANTFGVLNIYSTEPNAFTPDEMRLLEELAGDLAFGIVILRARIERKRTEETLRYLASIVQSSDDAIIGKTLDGIVTSWNKGAERIYGYTESEIIGNPISILVPSERKDEVSLILEKIKTGEHIAHYETVRRKKDGQYIDMSLSISSVRDMEGKIIGASTIGRDITERKRAEEVVRESEAQLNEAQRIAHIGSWQLDISNNVLSWSDEIYRMFEIDPGEFGASYEAFLEAIHPDDREAVNFAYTNSLNTRTPYTIEHRLQFADGRIKYVHEQCETFYDADGKPIRSSGTVQDITERKQAEEALHRSEERFRRLAENARDVIYRMSLPDGKYEYVSPAVLSVFGYSPEECYESPILIKQAIHPDWQMYFEEQWVNLVKGEMPPMYEYQFIHKSGEVRWMNQRNILVRDNAGNPIAIEGIVTDITERKQAEEALREGERRYHDIFDNVLDSLFLLEVTDDGRFRNLEMNPAFERSTGLSRAQLIGKLIEETVPEEVASIVNAKYRRCIEAGHPIEEEMALDLPTGRRYFHSTLIPARDETGRVFRIIGISRDITERKRTEAEIQALAKFPSENPNPVLRISKDGVLLYANRASLDLMKCWNCSVGERLPDSWRKLTMDVLGFGLLREEETVCGERVFALMLAPIVESGYVNLYGRDITERKRAEEAVRAASVYNRSLIEASLDPLVTIGPDGKITDVNEATETATGVLRERLIGDNFSNYFTEPEKANVGYQAVLAEGLVKDYPLTIRHTSGKTMDVLYNATIYNNESGEIRGVFAAARDITERKRAEEEISRSLEAEKKAREVAEILREANESLSRTLELDDVLQNLLQYLSRLVPYDSANVMLLEDDFQCRVVALRGYERWTDINATRGITFDLSTTPVINEVVATQKSSLIANTYDRPDWIRPAGAEHVINWLGIPIVAGRQVIGLYSVDKVEPGFFTEEHRHLAEGLAGQAAVAIQNARLHDQIKRANVELEQRVLERTAQLEAANKELEAFAYSVSHDLRAPLRHIDGFLEMLQKRTKTSLDDQSQHYMEVISDAAKKMGTLIDDLLSFSRMGRNEMFKSQVDLDELVQDVIQEFKPEAEGRNIEWQTTPLPWIAGDQAMLRIVLVNLISNALKFTRPRKIAQIEIGCERKDETEVVIFVRDNGVGFDMNYADKLFGVFQRLHRQEDFEGTGIGLANVHRIISRHGGRTWADGQIDHGATFYFSLPTSK